MIRSEQSEEPGLVGHHASTIESIWLGALLRCCVNVQESPAPGAGRLRNMNYMNFLGLGCRLISSEFPGPWLSVDLLRQRSGVTGTRSWKVWEIPL